MLATKQTATQSTDKSLNKNDYSKYLLDLVRNLMSKILHIGGNDKFIPPFIEFLKLNFNFKQHEFMLCSGMGKKPKYKNVHIYQRTVLQRLKFYLLITIKMHRAAKIILHGLFDIKLMFILFFTPWLLKKCYWIIWGGDLYTYKFDKRNKRLKMNEFFRRFVIKNIGYLVTYIKGDIELAREWYGAKGKHIECLMYLSNVYRGYYAPPLLPKKDSSRTILLGNSADPSNNHLEVLDRLMKYVNEDIKIIVPLSYGDDTYANNLIHQGMTMFGNKFIPLTDFMPFEEYLKILAEVDIAIFNHKRQQAMGNTIALLGLGKKVYMRSDVVQWKLFQDIGVEISDVKGISETIFEPCSKAQKENPNIIKDFFSEDRFLKQLKTFLG